MLSNQIASSEFLPLPTVSSLHLHLNLLEQQYLPRIRDRLPPHLNIRISLRTVPFVLEVKIHNHPRHNHLDLIRRKEPPGTRMSSMPEIQILLIRRHKLILCIARRPAPLSQLREAESVKGSRGGVECGVHIDGMRGDLDGDARRDVLAVREGEALEYFAVEGGDADGVEARAFLHKAVEFDHLLQGERGNGPVVCGGNGAYFIPQRLDIFVASGREVV
jgi:hypothetical protein